jgi:hypothetical protein
MRNPVFIHLCEVPIAYARTAAELGDKWRSAVTFPIEVTENAAVLVNQRLMSERHTNE